MIRARLATALVALLAAVAVLLLPLPLPRNAIAYALEDAGHMPLTAALCLLCLWVLGATGWSVGRRCLFTLAIGVGFGAATELLQGLTGRDASWLDLRNDALGALAAVAAYWLIRHRDRLTSPPAAIRAWSLIAVLVLAAAAMLWVLPLARALQAWQERTARFPVLYAADFARTEFVLQAVGTTRKPLQPMLRGERQVLPVQCGAARFSGVTIDGLHRDWRGWRALRVVVANPTNKPVDIGILVREARRRMAYDERFNLELSLDGGETRSLRIALPDIQRAPKGRSLDLARVGSMAIFCAGQAREFDLISAALE